MKKVMTASLLAMGALFCVPMVPCHASSLDGLAFAALPLVALQTSATKGDDPPDQGDPPEKPDKPDKPDPDHPDDDGNDDDGPPEKSTLGLLGATPEEEESFKAGFSKILEDSPLGKTFDLQEQLETTREMAKRFSGDDVALQPLGDFKVKLGQRGFGTEFEQGIEIAFNLEPGIDFGVGMLMSVLDAMVIQSVMSTAGGTLPLAAVYFSYGRTTLQSVTKEAALAIGVVGLQAGYDATEYLGDMIRESIKKEHYDYKQIEQVNPGILP